MEIEDTAGAALTNLERSAHPGRQTYVISCSAIAPQLGPEYGSRKSVWEAWIMLRLGIISTAKIGR
ncbi:hypothetical protein ACC846_39010, partial [Rhizobium ruizarguesonis]